MSALLPVAAFTAGILTHLLYYKQYDFHLNPLRNIQGFSLGASALLAVQVTYFQRPVVLAATSTLSLVSIFLAGIFASLLTYRTFFNPLNKFPGPFMARISKLSTSIRIRKLDGHHQLLQLHEKHGRYVRIGPNDLSVADPDAVAVISAPNSQCIKAPWYDSDSPMTSMHTSRDRAKHDKRRRIWAPAFSDKALRGYKTRIEKYNDMLIQQLEKTSGQPVNASKWFNLYAFDVMGDLGFGEPFGMIEKGEEHWAIALLSAGLDPIGLWFPTWFFRTLISIPGATNDYYRFIAYCGDQLRKRIATHKGSGGSGSDITGYLIDALEKAENKQQAMKELDGDSRLIIVAGSDTTSATLTHLSYHLAQRPEIAETIRKEVAPMIDADGNVSYTKVQDAHYLNGCINETLRLHPPVPCGVFRQTPKEGVSIGEVFVPGKTVIQIPGYVTARDEKIYPRPLEFIPERWSTQPELILHKDAWQPFSSGPYGCIGKALALMELRTLLASVITHFDIAFAPGEDGTKLLTETTEHFTLGVAPLNLVFTKRQGASA